MYHTYAQVCSNKEAEFSRAGSNFWVVDFPLMMIIVFDTLTHYKVIAIIDTKERY